jgi:hypothetical protein
VCSLQILLHARHYAPPSAVFSKIVSDCLGYSKRRHTISSGKLVDDYRRYLVDSGENELQSSRKFLEMDFSGFKFPVGREVVMCEAGEGLKFPRGTYILEFYRFDEDGNKRIKFFNNTVRLGDGTEMKTLLRTATMAGMQRVLNERPSLTEKKEIIMMPINSDEDFEIGHTAELYRQNPFWKIQILLNACTADEP